jgi:hypothetical protein
MTEILRTSELLAQGYEKAEVQRLVRQGALRQVRRGAYVRAEVTPEPTSAEESHQLLVSAVALQALSDGVISHASAAVLHGLPVWNGAIARVHVTRGRSTGARRRADIEVHSATLPPAHVTTLAGVRTTSLARTVADLGRTQGFAQAVAAGDRAVTLGLDFGDLDEVLQSMQQWPGVRQARRVADFLDGRSESAGESVSRVRLWEQGLPFPIPQREIFDSRGLLIGRVDFCWEDRRTVGEFDGRVKYGRLLKPGQRLEDVLFAEKLREDALRDAGWQVVRWIWPDLERRGLLRDRVLRAFARAGR